MPMLNFYKAELSDAADIRALVNRAYRGEPSRKGWTTEADLLEGIRVTTAEIAQIVQSRDQFMLIGELNQKIVACMQCQKQSYEGKVIALWSMIAVEPTKQSNGHGTDMIHAAEAISKREWGVAGFAMTVIAMRDDVIGFYGRLGYQRTNTYLDFPVNPEKWQPKVAGLTLQYLFKAFQSPS